MIVQGTHNKTLDKKLFLITLPESRKKKRIAGKTHIQEVQDKKEDKDPGKFYTRPIFKAPDYDFF